MLRKTTKRAREECQHRDGAPRLVLDPLERFVTASLGVHCLCQARQHINAERIRSWPQIPPSYAAPLALDPFAIAIPTQHSIARPALMMEDVRRPSANMARRRLADKARLVVTLHRLRRWPVGSAQAYVAIGSNVVTGLETALAIPMVSTVSTERVAQTTAHGKGRRSMEAPAGFVLGTTEQPSSKLCQCQSLLCMW